MNEWNGKRIKAEEIDTRCWWHKAIQKQDISFVITTNVMLLMKMDDEKNRFFWINLNKEYFFLEFQGKQTFYEGNSKKGFKVYELKAEGNQVEVYTK